jgi:hypothetical protein
MEYITDKGIILMVLISEFMIISGVAITLLIGRWLSLRHPGESASIIRFACIISIAITIIFGILADTVIVLIILWTVGYF